MLNFIRPIANRFPISQLFGANRKMYEPMGFAGHMGIDYACPIGTPVLSAYWGEVIEIGWSNTGYGAYIKIKCGKYTVLYGHLSTIKVVRGCYITRGQQIGLSGNTGNSTGPHLHFEIKDPNKLNNGFHGRIDPIPFLEKSKQELSVKLKRIHAEIAEIQKNGYSKNAMYIHVKYIERILFSK